MKSKLIMPLIAMLLLAGCKKATYLESDVKDLTVSIAGDCDTIILHSDVNDFHLDAAPEWLTPELKDSVLVVNIGKNDSKGERKGDIVISNGDLKLTIPVTQQYKATHLELPAGNEVKIGKEGGTQTLDVDCDGNVTVEGTEGFEATYNDGKLTVKAPKNDGAAINKTLKLTADEFSKDVKVIIEGAICGTCNGSGKIKCRTCHGSGVAQRFNGAFMTGGPCPTCGGPFGSNGRVTCPTCKGKGK